MAPRKELQRTERTWPVGGYWRRIVVDGQVTARIGCPECHYVATLEDHEISDKGEVTPSVLCPNHGCRYHAVGVVLVDWEP